MTALAADVRATAGRPQPSPRVLVIEDDLAIRRMVKLGLQHAGFEVKVAEDGATGLEMVEHDAPDLVVLDVRMPRMDGIEFLDRLRGNPAIAGTRVLVFSNFSERDTIDQCRRRGALDYVIKSTLTPRELAQVIARLLV